MIVTIPQGRLIDLLEEEFGNVYENIKEEDRITQMRFIGTQWIEFIIGEEDDTGN